MISFVISHERWTHLRNENGQVVLNQGIHVNERLIKVLVENLPA